jgi:hypothetical protein
MRRAIAAIGLAMLAACAPASIGCGEGDERDIEEAFGELRRAYLTEDYPGICARMSTAVQREIGQLGHDEPTTCVRDMAQNMSAAVLSPRDRVDPKIEEIEVDGDRATVLATLGGTTPGNVHFVKQDGDWKLDQLFGTTAPPAPDLR